MRNTFARLSEDDLHFSWQAQHFGPVHLHFARQAQHFRRVVLRVFGKSHCQGCVRWWQRANRVAGVGHGECQFAWWRSVVLLGRRGIWDTLDFTLHTWHLTLHTLQFTLHTPTLHFTLLHLTPRTLHSTLYTLHFALHSPHSTLHTLHSALHTLHFTLRSTLHTLHSTLYTRHFALHNPHFIAYTLNPPLNTPLSSLSSHSILCTPAHVALHSLHWYGSRGKMYKTVEIICFTKMFYVPAFGFIGFSFFLTLLVVHFYYMYPHKTP